MRVEIDQPGNRRVTAHIDGPGRRTVVCFSAMLAIVSPSTMMTTSSSSRVPSQAMAEKEHGA